MDNGKMNDTCLEKKYYKNKVSVKLWESDFINKNGRKPNKDDIRNADATIRKAYKMYWSTKYKVLNETLKFKGCENKNKILFASKLNSSADLKNDVSLENRVKLNNSLTFKDKNVDTFNNRQDTNLRKSIGPSEVYKSKLKTSDLKKNRLVKFAINNQQNDNSPIAQLKSESEKQFYHFNTSELHIKSELLKFPQKNVIFRDVNKKSKLNTINTFEQTIEYSDSNNLSSKNTLNYKVENNFLNFPKTSSPLCTPDNFKEEISNNVEPICNNYLLKKEFINNSTDVTCSFPSLYSNNEFLNTSNNNECYNDFKTNNTNPIHDNQKKIKTSRKQTKKYNENFIKINLKKKVFIRGHKSFNFSKFKKDQWIKKKKKIFENKLESANYLYGKDKIELQNTVPNVNQIQCNKAEVTDTLQHCLNENNYVESKLTVDDPVTEMHINEIDVIYNESDKKFNLQADQHFESSK